MKVVMVALMCITFSCFLGWRFVSRKEQQEEIEGAILDIFAKHKRSGKDWTAPEIEDALKEHFRFVRNSPVRYDFVLNAIAHLLEDGKIRRSRDEPKDNPYYYEYQVSNELLILAEEALTVHFEGLKKSKEPFDLEVFLAGVGRARNFTKEEVLLALESLEGQGLIVKNSSRVFELVSVGGYLT